jgi:hypothetical protein
MTIKKQTPDPARAFTYTEYFTQAIVLLANSLDNARYTEFDMASYLEDDGDPDPEQVLAEDRTLESAIKYGEGVLPLTALYYQPIIQIFETACCVLGEKYREAKAAAIQRDIRAEMEAEMKRAAGNLDRKA